MSRRVLLAEEIGEVLIATGDSEIKDIVESYGGKVVSRITYIKMGHLEFLKQFLKLIVAMFY